MAPLRVLTVARWYPSHDARFRGVFVADLVRALGGLGVDSVVASWEAAVVHAGRLAAGNVERAVAAWTAAVERGAVLSTPVDWGAGVPVARLPVVDDAASDGWRDVVAAHAALLEPLVLGMARGPRFDLVHAHTGAPDGLVAAAVADRLGVPLVVTEHASNAVRSIAEDPSLAAAYRTLLDDPRRLVSISPASRARLAAALAVDEARIGLIGNVVDTTAFPVSPAADRDPKDLLWVGERSTKKGADVLLRAFAMLAQDDPALRLRLIGRSPTPQVEGEWMALAAELGIAARVAFEGPADRAGVALAMARAAAFVHPSPAETFGIVAAEAVASGLPVAATPSGGVEDIVGQDGALGTIAIGHEPAALAAAVADVLARRSSFDSRAMHESIAARFGAPVVAGAYERLYRELLAAAPAPASPASPEPASPDLATPNPMSPHGDAALVVGLQRTLLDRRLASFPWPGRAGITIVTVAGKDRASSQGWTDALVEVDPDAWYRSEMARLSGPTLSGIPGGVARGLRFLLRPRAGLARRRLLAQREERRIAESQRLVLEAWRQRVAAGDQPWLVALDPVDVVAARTAIDAGARLAPGGMRWLADRLDAADAAKAG